MCGMTPRFESTMPSNVQTTAELIFCTAMYRFSSAREHAITPSMNAISATGC